MSKRNIKLLVIFLAVLLLFGYFFNYRGRRLSLKYDREIINLQTELARQKIFQPVYARLLEQSNLDIPESLPMPAKTPLPRERIADLPEVYRQLAEATNTDFQVVIPDITSLGKDSKWLRLDVLVRGQFFDLRDLMLKIGEMPYLEHIEQIKVTTRATKECNIRMWLAVAPGQE